MSPQTKLDLKGWVEGQSMRDGRDPWEWRAAPACFRIRDVVNIFQFGATERDAYHLSECGRCRRWLGNYAKSTAGVQVAHKSLFKVLTDLFRASQNQPFLMPTPLYLLGNAIEVGNPGDLIAIDIAILGEFSEEGSSRGHRIAEIDLKTLKLDGALLADEATLEWKEIERVGYPVIHFGKARLANVPRKGLEEHYSLTDSIFLTGQFTGKSPSNFIGHADVHFVRPAIEPAVQLPG
jgi:hypothetical protein